MDTDIDAHRKNITRFMMLSLCRYVAPLWTEAGTLDTAYWSDLMVDAQTMADLPDGVERFILIRNIATHMNKDPAYLTRIRLQAGEDWSTLCTVKVVRKDLRLDITLVEDHRHA